MTTARLTLALTALLAGAPAAALSDPAPGDAPPARSISELRRPAVEPSPPAAEPPGTTTTTTTSTAPTTSMEPPRPAAEPRPIAAPSRASAEPPRPVAAIKPVSFELLDRGDAVEIIAHNVKAARTAVLPLRSRLQVPIAGAPSARRLAPGDATVKLIEVGSDDATRMLSVKLGFDPADVKALARFAQAIQVGDDLHLLVPRKVPVDGSVPRLPDPTLPPDLAAMVAQIDAPRPIAGVKPAPASDAKLAADSEIEIHAAAGTAASAAAEDGRPAATGTHGRDGKALSQALASDPADAWSKISMYAALGLAAAGAGIWLMRRRRAGIAPPATIEIIAQRSLGGKARIVWLSAGQREMLVSVTAQQVRMLGQWRKSDTAGALPAAHAHREASGGELRGDTRHEPRRELRDEPGDQAIDERSGAIPVPVADRPLSPAVSGILRLRGRTGQMPAVSADLAPGDVVADEAWAKEILAATGARR
jgi:flagellar biogenesis protein FliO